MFKHNKTSVENKNSSYGFFQYSVMVLVSTEKHVLVLYLFCQKVVSLMRTSRFFKHCHHRLLGDFKTSDKENIDIVQNNLRNWAKMFSRNLFFTLLTGNKSQLMA